MAGKVRHFQNRAGRYYARMAVPGHLRKAIGLRELTEALDGDRTIALRMLPIIVGKFQARLDDARKQLGAEYRPTTRRRNRPLDIRAMALAHYHDELDMDTASRDDSDFVHIDYRKYGPKVANAQRRLLERAASGRASNEEIDAAVGWAIDQFRNDGHTKEQRVAAQWDGSEAERVTPGWRALGRTLAQIQLEALNRSAERDEGDFNGKSVHALLTTPAPAPNDPLAARNIGPDSTKPLSELVPLFLNERKMSPASQSEQRVSARMFEEVLGEQRPAYRITKQDIINYKNALLRAPASYVKRFPNMTLPQAIAANEARKEPYPKLNLVTINDKLLANLRSLLTWCAQNNVLPDSPATGVRIDVKKGENNGQAPRVNFQPSDLRKIFAPPLFDRAKPWGEQQWAYLLSLFAGTRPTELAQVRLDSIGQEYGILVMRIEGETKNLVSQRTVPIHRALIELGLETRIVELRKLGSTHLFPEWYGKGMMAKEKAEKRATEKGETISTNHFFKRFLPRRFNDTYRKQIGIEDDRKDFYSFRHTFKTRLAQSGVNKEFRDHLTGHKDRSAGAVYVHGISLERVKQELDKLRFDGIDHLFKS